MPVLSIQYDLYKETGRVYDKLIAALDALPSWARPTESVWLISTTMTPKQVVEYLKPHLHRKDKLLVTPVALGEGWWSEGLPANVLEWLQGALQARRAS